LVRSFPHRRESSKASAVKREAGEDWGADERRQ
jgi:hypothetical protein